MPKVNGHIVTWREDTQEFWEYTDDLEMLVYLYDKAIEKCGEEHVYLFPIKDVLTMVETRRVIEGYKHELRELGW